MASMKRDVYSHVMEALDQMEFELQLPMATIASRSINILGLVGSTDILDSRISELP